MGRRESALEVGEELVGRPGRGVTAVEQGMDPHCGDAGGSGDLGDGDGMAIYGVDASRPDEADEMKPPVCVRGRSGCLRKGGIREEAPVRDRGVDAREILEHRTTGAQVEVTDLAVPHLSLWEPDGLGRRVQSCVRPPIDQVAPHGHARRSDRVSVR
jgi:hypothetical protein